MQRPGVGRPVSCHRECVQFHTVLAKRSCEESLLGKMEKLLTTFKQEIDMIRYVLFYFIFFQICFRQAAVEDFIKWA